MFPTSLVRKRRRGKVPSNDTERLLMPWGKQTSRTTDKPETCQYFLLTVLSYYFCLNVI